MSDIKKDSKVIIIYTSKIKIYANEATTEGEEGGHKSLPVTIRRKT